MYIIHSAFVPFRVHENSQESIDTLSIKNESSISAKINQAFKNNGRIFKITVTHREACQKEVFICVPFSSVFALSDVDFCYDCSWKKNVVGAASDNFIYDLEKTSFSFEYYCSKSSHSIEGRFQVAWIIDLQKWLFSLIMHEHILFTFNRKNTDSRPYHWRKGLCIYTKTVVTYVLT